MKLLRYKHEGRIRLGVLVEAGVVDLSALRYPTMLSVIIAGAEALDRIAKVVRGAKTYLPLEGLELREPIERPGKYLAIGMNYRKHRAEAERIGIAAPKAQLWFNKQTSCVAGPFDDIDPGASEQLDYEVELGAVIGKPAKNVSEQDARHHVFGYFVANDVSARDWQSHSPTFTIGKSFDTHGPIGPWIVTAGEIRDPHALELRCTVNGELRQKSNTREMIYNLWQQIAYLSHAFTLEPGDLIATGTPEGVGIGMIPPTYLTIGDVVKCEIEAIGAIENRVAKAQLRR